MGQGADRIADRGRGIGPDLRGHVEMVLEILADTGQVMLDADSGRAQFVSRANTREEQGLR